MHKKIFAHVKYIILFIQTRYHELTLLFAINVLKKGGRGGCFFFL